MSLELLVLVSSLNADVPKMVNNMNLKCDCLVINQCDKNNYYEFKNRNNKVYVYETKERGLSNSRNMALEEAKKLPYDIYLIADDDVIYHQDYKENILEGYSNREHADIIIYDIERINHLSQTRKKRFLNFDYINISLIPIYYGSVRISIRSEFLRDKNIKFNESFGTGSNKYLHGEDSLFLKACRKNNAKIYKSQKEIAQVDFAESTWRSNSFEKLCYDKGALWYELSDHFYWFFGIIIIFKLSYAQRKPFLKSYKHFLKGVRERGAELNSRDTSEK